MNSKVAIFISSAASFIVSGTATGLIVRRIYRNQEIKTLAEIHQYYHQLKKDYDDLKERHTTLMSVISKRPDADDIFKAVNEKLLGGENEENSNPAEPKVYSPDEARGIAKTEDGLKAVSEAMRANTQAMATPYHQMYKNGSDAIVGPSTGILEKLGQGYSPKDIINEDDFEEEPEMEDAYQDPTPSEPPAMHDRPYLITRDELGDEWHEPECLIFYDGDSILANELGEVLDIESYIGSEALEHFEDNTVYVRNDRLGMDYEVRWEEGSYTEVVLGVPMSEAYPEGVAKMRRRKPRNADEFK